MNQWKKDNYILNHWATINGHFISYYDLYLPAGSYQWGLTPPQWKLRKQEASALQKNHFRFHYNVTGMQVYENRKEIEILNKNAGKSRPL